MALSWPTAAARVGERVRRDDLRVSEMTQNDRINAYVVKKNTANDSILFKRLVQNLKVFCYLPVEKRLQHHLLVWRQKDISHSFSAYGERTTQHTKKANDNI